MSQKITSLKQLGELVTTTRPNGSRRVQLDVSEPQLTDQSMAKSTEINNILKMYSSQNINPAQPIDPSLFRDNTNIPSIIDAYNIVNKAQEAFYALPADVRKLMDNDPSKLEDFILDPENKDLLIKRGVLTAQPAPAAVDPIKEVKPAAEAKETKS